MIRLIPRESLKQELWRATVIYGDHISFWWGICSNPLCVCVNCSVVSDSLRPHGLPGSSVHGILQARILECRSPTPAARDSTWRDDGVGQWDSLSVFYGLPVYFKFKILFYSFTKTLGQRFDIFSSPSPRFIISINHCCSSNRVPASVILSESALSSIIYLF